MSLRNRLLLVTFLESAATILLERGIYFFTEHILRFTNAMNLGLAVVFGFCYVLGALGSQRISDRTGTRRLVLAVMVINLVLLTVLCFVQSVAMIFVAMVFMGLLNGVKWPVIESYVSAGSSGKGTSDAVGYFNISWSLSVPIALAVVGPLIYWRQGTALGDAALFLMGIALSVPAFMLTWTFPRHATHLPPDHPQRPSPEKLARLRRLLSASRWLMFAVYSMLFVLAPLMPSVFKNLGVGINWGPAASGSLDVMRLMSFIMLRFWVGWHDRRWPLVVAMLGAPVGMVMTLLSGSLPVVLVGGVIFGLSAGMVYYAALYYAMVVSNASVDAGGAHEGVIGSGFFIGPLVGFAGNLIGAGVGDPMMGVVLGALPIVVVCSVVGWRKLAWGMPGRVGG
ncbi:MAG: MFS transporter [Phycisphaera sp.]|nr:MFS transporter [Phycisphaera sp.]